MLEHVHPVHVFVGKLQVADDEVVAAAVEQLDGLRAVRGRVNRVALLDEILLERVGHHRLVVNDQNAHVLTFHVRSPPVREMLNAK